jgi:hypothetical protein
MSCRDVNSARRRVMNSASWLKKLTVEGYCYYYNTAGQQLGTNSKSLLHAW